MTWNTLFSEFSDADQERWIVRAQVWKANHSKHVEKLMDGDTEYYQPSGSDCGKPELWKGGHWRWFVGKKYHDV